MKDHGIESSFPLCGSFCNELPLALSRASRFNFFYDFHLCSRVYLSLPIVLHVGVFWGSLDRSYSDF